MASDRIEVAATRMRCIVDDADVTKAATPAMISYRERGTLPDRRTHFSAENMRDTHQVIIDNTGEMICRVAILLDDDKVVIPESRPSYLPED